MPEPSNQGSKPSQRRKIIIGAALGAVTATGLTSYFIYGRYFPNTPDAYVHAFTITVSPYVDGYIKTIDIQPNQLVKKGQLIYEIEPKTYQLTVDRRKSELDAAIAAKASLEEQLKTAEQDLADKSAAKWIVSINQKRLAYLLKQEVVALEKEQQLEASKLEATAKVRKANANIAKIKKEILQQGSKIKALRAVAKNAAINLKYTKYYSPIDAYVSNTFSIRKGQYVKPGQALFKLVDNSNWWIDANYKESQIHRIRKGMKAKIKLDMYPGVEFEGEVINISAGSGAYYSLLPPQNATGNWVKVPQRFPVRIRIEQNKKHPFRAGSTANATINTL